ncbi:MAG: hypothetical protein UY04_C0036G0008 [Parcubacteria group bacterium GW2011_GWA2_47_7]|nr:MAG: hypothetical protein UY04_C0036G0008 [Parcubacteria group bacterium GW2011_GWA2_47_7]
MSISLEVLRKAAGQYALNELRGTDQEKVQLIIEMLDRCSSPEVRELLNKSQEDITFDVRINVKWTIKCLCVTKNGVQWYGYNPNAVGEGERMYTLNQRENAKDLLSTGCNIRKLERKFWADIQKIIDEAPE